MNEENYLLQPVVQLSLFPFSYTTTKYTREYRLEIENNFAPLHLPLGICDLK